ncbi:DUF2283 domain-containing protein [Streptomyces avicenniae]|uniref:DUF2283 domain-containing protein n=1 Tax=Streptomyces avicenniae TaxID=500153 RepID=UPI001CBA6758|nr:DUF2283 domain-containing protein [Streptomyces avicenniae]
MRITYDAEADAAYLYFADPRVETRVARMYPCDPVQVEGMINLDFDEASHLVGIEILAARSKLPGYLLEMAERVGPSGECNGAVACRRCNKDESTKTVEVREDELRDYLEP